MMRRKISYITAAVLSKDAWAPQLLWLLPLALVKTVCRPEELWLLRTVPWSRTYVRVPISPTLLHSTGRQCACRFIGLVQLSD